MKKIVYGLAVVALVAAVYACSKQPQTDVPVVVATAPIAPLTPEVLKALNEKLGAVAIDVPLPSETFRMPDRELNTWIKTWKFSNGRYMTGGTLVVGFQGPRIVRNEPGHLEIVLGAPVTRALDDTFANIEPPESSMWSSTPSNLFEQARAKGRMISTSTACARGDYDTASEAAVLLLVGSIKAELAKQIACPIDVSVKITKAHCG